MPNLDKLAGINAGSESSYTLKVSTSFFANVILESSFISNGRCDSIIKSFSATNTLSPCVSVYKLVSKATFAVLLKV